MKNELLPKLPILTAIVFIFIGIISFSIISSYVSGEIPSVDTRIFLTGTLTLTILTYTGIVSYAIIHRFNSSYCRLIPGVFAFWSLFVVFLIYNYLELGRSVEEEVVSHTIFFTGIVILGLLSYGQVIVYSVYHRNQTES